MTGVYGRDHEVALGERFVDRGGAGLTRRPGEAEVRFALSALADLLEGVTDEVIVALRAPQRRALTDALVRVESAGEAAEQRTLAAALRSLLPR